MCTAISTDGLFGRTLDVERSYGEEVVITPRDYRIDLVREPAIKFHQSMIGMATVREGRPLYFDAMNESGLCIAALNFPKNAVYNPPRENMNNVASFEFIPWVLCNSSSVAQAVELLKRTNITNDNFSAELSSTPLHWLVSDKVRSITVESVESGLRIYENSFGVLTNNPPFSYHIEHISNFVHLNPNVPKNTLCPRVEVELYSRGMGAMGLPGDFSSTSRFVRAVYAKTHTESLKNSKNDRIYRFFHIMDTVNVPFGCVKTETGENSYTLYTSCMDMETKTYYFTTYMCRKIQSISL